MLTTEEKFIRRVKERREAKGWTCPELAAHVRMCGVHMGPKMMIEIENGARKLQAHEIQVLCHLLGIDLREVFASVE